jgi:hypothetical protein
MGKNILGPRYRPAWAILAVALTLAIAFSFAPVRTLAGEFLGLFRVQRIQFVAVEEGQLPDKETLQAAAKTLEGVMRDQVQIQADGEPQVVDQATARALAPYPIRLPDAGLGEPQITLRPATRVSMQVDLASTRAMLAELGYDDIDLPDSLDGAEIEIDFAPLAIAAYGPCGPEAEDVDGACTVFTQMPATEVSAPPELDLEQLGQAYLQLAGMSADEAARYSERVDWTTTMIVALPSSSDLGFREVTVDGVTGTLVRPSSRSRNADEYLVTWLKEGMVYALFGKGADEEALRIVGSLP